MANKKLNAIPNLQINNVLIKKIKVVKVLEFYPDKKSNFLEAKQKCKLNKTC